MCKSTTDETVYSTCFAGKGDLTYLQWLLQAWGWTLLVALVALVIALVLGLVIGVMRTLPNKAWRCSARHGRSCSATSRS